MVTFFDSEFLEDGETIDLISIGMVRNDGEELYLVSNEFDLDRVSKDEWLVENVLKHLPDQSEWVSRADIAAQIVPFVGKNPIFVADYGSYDWVGLCQLYGKMIDLPDTWPMFVRDIQQWRHDLRVKKFPDFNKKKHDALSDARECFARYHFLDDIAQRAGIGPLIAEAR